MRIKGRIKRFFEDKGYGFISFSERQGDIFFHITNFLDDSDKNIVEEGLEVEFRIGPGRGGQGESRGYTDIEKTGGESFFI